MNWSRTAPSEIDDPFLFFAHLRSAMRNAALLESLGPIEDSTSRYSIIGAMPVEELLSDGSRAWRVDCKNGERVAADWMAVLDEWSPRTLASPRGPTQTGAIGFVSYDANPARESRTWFRPADVAVPEVRLIRYGATLVFDRITGSSEWAYEPPFEDAVRTLEQGWQQWRDAPRPAGSFEVYGDIGPDVSPDDMLDKVATTIEYIRAGDISQANITARFSAGYGGDLFEAYARLRETTPNPFFAYLDFDPPLLSTSPERFFQVVGTRITSRPIKGTARAVVNGIDQRTALLASPKDRAENVMIVDVVRNDLGRVCRRGSVRVESLCEAKRFNHLYHLESTVSGELEDGAPTSRVLGALFPPASISGAPKLRAIDVIDELEPVRRGPYCGAIGFFGSQGWVDTSVAIRVVYADSGRIYLHAGGGIVVDSNPIAESEELLLKAEALLRPLDSFNVLAAARRAIDAVDDRLFAALEERFALVSQIAEIKREHGIPSLQASRVEAMKTVRERQAAETGTIPAGLINDLYDLLVGHAMRAEEQRMDRSRPA